VARGLGALPGRPAAGVREFAGRLLADEASRYLGSVCHFSAAQKHDLYTADLASQFATDRTAARFAARLQASRAGDDISRLIELDLHTYLPDDILTKVDIASMAHGLEARAPLVDHHVLELAARLPVRDKVRGLRGKHLLRRAFAEVLPPSIQRRGKRGFSLPLDGWFRGELDGFARDVLLSTAARGRGLFRPERVERLLARHQAGEDHGDRLWNLVALELWFKNLVDDRRRFAADVARRAGQARAAAPSPDLGPSASSSAG
jgi:asparagine synthase (glutamine-hydrolysing)